MLDFEVKRCTRKCFATSEELKPGENFYSVLVPEGGEIVRRDFSQAAWTGPPDAHIGWWQSRMPDPNEKKVDWAPSDVILHYFQELGERPETADTKYILTLLMIRRRLLRLEETERADNGAESLILFCPKNDAEYRVAVVEPTPERALAIQNELAELLFSMSGD